MMFSWLTRLVSSCLRPVRQHARMKKDIENDFDVSSKSDDALVWCKDLEKHSCGEFSFAIVQANEVMEDHSQVETGSDSVFVGVYDGHGGPDASRFVNNHLFNHLIRIAKENDSISEDIIRNAVTATEDGFMTLVRRSLGIKPLIAAMGSCCLVGVIWKGTLYIANLGDSRAVIGSIGRSNKIVAKKLTKEHNACKADIRAELRSLHPEDSQIVVMKHGTWRVKGIIQVSRSIGDAFLKRLEFSFDPSFPKFHLSDPICRPVLSAEPSMCSIVLQPNDQFVIFASDGLWEHMTNQEAAEIVHSNPRTGIARRLLQTALNEAARKSEMSYKDLLKVEKGIRRFIHDDITVVVVFIDHELQNQNVNVPELSIKGFIDTVGPSKFSSFQEMQ